MTKKKIIIKRVGVTDLFDLDLILILASCHELPKSFSLKVFLYFKNLESKS